MTASSGSNVPPAKRRKLDHGARGEAEGTGVTSASLSRPVSPPVSRRKSPTSASTASTSLLVPAPTWGFDDVPKQILTPPPSQPPRASKSANQNTAAQEDGLKPKRDHRVAGDNTKCVPSPFQLTKIRDVAPHQNEGTVELKYILGDPLIKECWNFNFLFDLDFVMQQFHEDVRDMVRIKIIHGFWRRDDERRIHMMETAERYPNMELINAYLPDPFGTHHSKMLILFWHDERAQVIIHTANMISKDWTNMTQAVWRSPLLELSRVPLDMGPHAIGSGLRFHIDLRRYLLQYEKKLQKLVGQLSAYNFSPIKAAFLGSAPSRQVASEAKPVLQTSFGWLGLQEILNSIPLTARRDPKKRPHIVLQVSSIATLGAAPAWLSHFQSVLSRARTPQQLPNAPKPKFNIIFPTAEEVRTSLDGYESGGSIHVKLQSAQQKKQLQYMHPLLCHWKDSSPSSPSMAPETKREAHRGPAAPHIKTYFRFADETHRSIDWALVTSANLSKQAWGDVVNKQGEVRIQSYETGVLVWPDLFKGSDEGDESEATMVPTFGRDMPDTNDGTEEVPELEQNMGHGRADTEDEETGDKNLGPIDDDEETEDEDEEYLRCSNAVQSKGKGKLVLRSKKRIVIGLRMPYDLPLSPYGAKDVPWCATQTYTEPDWKGRTWGAFQPR
ncbi:phospholipase D/nuclease [Didymella exigua CBS 183.55]|uniref:Phospholipase D/nuclease n=1 Tax=Didymella exigua CBS 183.55 TaxID=1150837 RepID=A0A6A5RLP7_9PLEO|nr:phospholipase D/nuclease [Didymella exigua CBS 183.55]KAF1926457.1 phospholipase D/nuclease [Didymella exigua CBS 183.55]